jgi:4-diphosphocytidyl-2-C-methyl-D-erythritol kinase
MLYRCYAKINLTLEVLGRREDGFHELASVVHTISLADDLRIEAANEILTRVEGIEAIDNNLVTRAAHLLAAETHTRQGAELTLLKRIPTAAGLGGGSSDAAATLVGLNSLWSTGLGYHAVAKLAAQLGSDVPFFVRGGAALMRGRGNELTPLPPLGGHWLILAVLSGTLPNKTATLYSMLTAEDFSTGEATQALAERLPRPVGDARLVNGFERAARSAFPGLDRLWGELERSAQRAFHLSGAGPTLFAFAADRREALALATQIAHLGVSAFAARTVGHARATIRTGAG